jgi:phosphoglycolate phosphatase-like HAD superfamily hydrolase
MTRAFEHVFGVPDALDGLPVAGRTDPAILDEALARADVTAHADDRQRFQDVYLPILAEEMHRPAPEAPHPSQHGRYKGPLPGVPELLQELAGRHDVFLALLTGNYSRAAEIKLDYFDLWRQFRCGAYGEDAERRHELVPVAIDRARAAGCPPVAFDDVIVIGDTPLDVECARLAGVRSLAVATGGFDVDTLRAAGADHAVESLADVRVVTAWLTA